MSATSKPIKIKEVIDTFCLLFRCHGYSKISAEILRQSKFDQRDVVIPLLVFVFNVLTKNLDHDFSSWNSSKKFMLVLSMLKEVGYPRTHLLFCKELVNMSSQELLLAFGYLLVKLDIIGKLRHDALHYVNAAIIESCNPGDTQPLTKSKISLNDSVRLTKKIEFLQRDLSTDSGYLEKLLREFNQIDKEHLQSSLISRGEPPTKDGGAKMKHFVKPNILDLIFFQNFKLQEHCIELLKKQIEMLRIHNKWVQQESLFWKWLSSIPKKHCTKAYTLGTTLELLRQPGQEVPFKRFLSDDLLKTIFQQCQFDFDDETELCNEVLDESFKNSLDDLKSSIRKIEDENKKWLQNLVTDRFPNYVQLPELKR